MNKYLLVIHAVVFISGLIIIWRKHGVLTSISQSYYQYEENAFFTIYLFLAGIPVVMMGNFWYFMSGASLCFVAAAPNFKDRLANGVHGTAAVLTVLFAISGLAVKGIWFPAIIVVVSALLLIIPKLKNRIKNKTWWLEITSFVATLSGMITEQINEGFHAG